MPRVVDLGRAHEVRHFLFGSTPEVLSGVEAALVATYPGAAIVGRHSPPFAEGGGATGTVETIGEADPDVVWCALGAPKQELWMHLHAAGLPGTLFVGVGAAFDFLAQTKRRAPGWMQDHGLEWLHRLGSEPSRLMRRYARTNAEFILRSGYELGRRRLVT